MIKITYIGEPYYYEHVGSQEYKITTEVVCNEDISGDEAIVAFLKVLGIATYRITPKQIAALAEKLVYEYEYEEDECIR